MMKGGEYYSALHDISNLVRVFTDKFECFTDDKAIELFEEFRTAFVEALTDRNIEV